ncbi:ATP-binding protein [Candidatus Saccharibacteria bacterium]|nr:ATP-binding protein [Candidatus Saccharibacteria bacterium]
MILLIVKGYPGVGKSTLSKKFAKKHDFALLQQDHFWFGLNPFTMNLRSTRPIDRQIGFKNLLSTAKNYIDAKKPILTEGALLIDAPGEPPIIPSLIKLADKHNYRIVIITLQTKDNVRKNRQRKRGYVLRPHIDNRLKKSATTQFADLASTTLDTSKLSIKKSLEALENLVFPKQP